MYHAVGLEKLREKRAVNHNMWVVLRCVASSSIVTDDTSILESCIGSKVHLQGNCCMPWLQVTFFGQTEP